MRSIKNRGHKIQSNVKTKLVVSSYSTKHLTLIDSSLNNSPVIGFPYVEHSMLSLMSSSEKKQLLTSKPVSATEMISVSPVIPAFHMG